MVRGSITAKQVHSLDRLYMPFTNLTLNTVKDVHKVPALDLVGWYTILPTSGPQPNHLPIHRQILHSYNESAIVLGFHATEVIEGAAGGKLPLTIYESNYEADETAGETGEDKEMRDEEPQLALKFKELPYSVETGEAEMISVDFVARGGGNATAVDGTVKKRTRVEVSDKGKGTTGAENTKADEDDDDSSRKDDQHILSSADEELIASLTAKANAIKMLHARINLIAAYLQNLPPPYVSNPVPEDIESEEVEYTIVNHSILRSIQALLSRLSLLIPADSAAFEHELESEQNDVNLVSLLSTITSSIKDVREVGRKFAIVDYGKQSKERGSHGRNMWDGPNGGVVGVGDLLS